VIRLALRVRREDAEAVLAELLELAPGGVEEIEDGDVVEYAVYGAAGELPALPDLRAAAGGALVEVTTSELADGWGERWREFHQPIEIGSPPEIRVRAPWHEARDGDVVIDPGQAFGTGGHATTRLCLELMTQIDPGGAVVDVGCGSGVLAIAAARMGWGPVLCLDHDQLAVDATVDNARVNGVEVEARRFDLRDELVPAAPLVLANLLRPLLLALRLETPPPVLIASGLLAHEGDEVAAHFASAYGLSEVRRAETDGWVALDLRAG
jgi:ribosomal protein L11 methyltransferase